LRTTQSSTTGTRASWGSGSISAEILRQRHGAFVPYRDGESSSNITVSRPKVLVLRFSLRDVRIFVEEDSEGEGLIFVADLDAPVLVLVDAAAFTY
jgi:hypothetical protein